MPPAFADTVKTLGSLRQALDALRQPVELVPPALEAATRPARDGGQPRSAP